jgi:hypothetical protein
MTTATLSHTPTQIGGIKRSNAYKALLADGVTERKALKRLGVVKVKPVTDPATTVAALIATGLYSETEAQAVVSGQFFTPTATVTALGKSAKKAKKDVEPEPEATSKTAADALVAQSGYAHGRGRVYVNAAIVEGIVRCLKTGSPEIINTSGVGRVPAVVIFREDSGDCALHNLYKP